MKIINVDEVLDGFIQLVDAKDNGEFAVWEFGGFVNTTDDVPEEYVNYGEPGFDEVVRQMKLKAIDRKEELDKLKEKNTGKKM